MPLTQHDDERPFGDINAPSKAQHFLSDERARVGLRYKFCDALQHSTFFKASQFFSQKSNNCCIADNLSDKDLGDGGNFETSKLQKHRGA